MIENRYDEFEHDDLREVEGYAPAKVSMERMTNTIKPPERVWLWVCPKGHIERAGLPDGREHNVCWACYPGGRIHNMERGPAEMVRFEYASLATDSTGDANGNR